MRSCEDFLSERLSGNGFIFSIYNEGARSVMKRRISMMIILFLCNAAFLLFQGCSGTTGDGVDFSDNPNNPTLTGVSVTPVSAVLSFDETVQLSATAQWSNSTSTDVSDEVAWDSSDIDVATVDTDGLVTASPATEGSVTIQAKYKSFTGTASIDVLDPSNVLVDLVIEPETGTIDADDEIQFIARGDFADGNNGVDITDQVTWYSSAPAVATINEDGLADGVNDGSTTIRASMQGINAEATLTVEDPIRSLAISPASATIQFGGTQQFTATATYASGDTGNATAVVNWYSTDEDLVEIDSSGLAEANPSIEGTCDIYADVDIDGATITSDNSPEVTVVEPNVESVAISSEDDEIDAGDTTQFTATVYFIGGGSSVMTGAVAWHSSNTGVATIDPSGLATGVNNGTSSITASYNGVTSNDISLSVDDPLVSIVVAPSTINLDIYSGPTTGQFSAQGTYASGDSATITSSVVWDSSNDSIATIDGNGLATAEDEGSAYITAALDGVTSNEASVIVGATEQPESVTISPASATIDADGSRQYSATVHFNDGSDMDMTSSVTWTSSQPTVATIDPDGLAEGVNNGSTTITATYSGINSNSSSLTVNDPLRSIDISPDSATINADETRQYAAQGVYASGDTADLTGSVTWSSSAGTVATINTSGLADAVNDGTTNITASFSGIISDTAALTVNDPLRSIDISPNSATLDYGETQQFTANGTYSSGDIANLTSSVDWTSSNTGIATIIDGASGGLATAYSLEGSTNISASLSGINSDTAVLTVDHEAAEPESVAITPTNTSIAADETQQYTALVTYDDSSTADMTDSVEWHSSNTSAATINTSGLADGGGAGSTTITATFAGLTSNSASLTVTNPLRSIDISPNSATIDADGTQQYSATGTYADASTATITTTVDWSSSNTGVATISDGASGGLADGVNNGTTTITASLSGVTSDSSTLTVNDPLRSIAVTPTTGSIDLSVTPKTLQFTATGTYASSDTANLTSNVDWSSSNTGVATITDGASGGLATGVNDVSGGTTNITAAYSGISSNTAVLTVIDPPVSLDISPNSATKVLGTTQQYAAVVSYASGDTATVTTAADWSSSNTTVATITDGSSGGLASCSAIGTSNITANYSSLTSDTSLLTVTNDPVSLAITPTSPSAINGGATLQFTATVTYQNGSTGNVTTTSTWTSSNTSAATIGANTGLATGVSGSGGTTNIRASYSGLNSNSVSLTVNPAPPLITSIRLYRGNSTSNTQMELWTAWRKDSGTYSTTFNASDTSQYTYLACNTQLTVVIAANNGPTSYNINGTTYTNATNTLTFTPKQDNALTIYASNAGGNSVTYTITVKFMTEEEWYYGLYARVMTMSKTYKWFAIVPSGERTTGLDIDIDSNTNSSANMRWYIALWGTINCNNTLADDAVTWLNANWGTSDTASQYCGTATGAWNWMNLNDGDDNAYNDGNTTYSGTQNDQSWSADWHTPGNEGGMSVGGDANGRITDVLAKDGTQRGIYNCYNAEGVLMGMIYIHYVVDNGDIKVDTESYVVNRFWPNDATNRQNVKHTYSAYSEYSW